METCKISVAAYDKDLFKSYYVVWKRNHKDNYSLSENTV